VVECIHPGLNVIVIRVTRTVRRWTGSYRSVPYGFKKPLKIEQLIQTVKILGRTNGNGGTVVSEERRGEEASPGAA
jgi:hypothetical protein